MSLIMAEYRCPNHGVFESLVERNENGDAPDEQKCMVWLTQEETEAHGHKWPGYPQLYCGEYSPWTMSAPKPKVLSVACYAEIRGGDTERRPGMLDTRPLADGMPLKEWKAKEAKVTQERRHQQLIKKGLKAKRIQVG